jgi:hypothetical protein
MNNNPTPLFVALGFFFLIGILVVACSSDDKNVTRIPDHTVSVKFEDIPVYQVEDIAKLNETHFSLVQLKDGHDYWFYRQSRGERGYSGLTHCHACKKCAVAGSSR